MQSKLPVPNRFVQGLGVRSMLFLFVSSVVKMDRNFGNPQSQKMHSATIRWLLSTAFCIGLSVASQEDYLDTQLRAEVEALIDSVSISETTRATASQRAQTLWRWVNAYALDGRYVPVNLTQVVSSVLGVLPPNQRIYPALDNYIKELALLDKDPGALGQLVAEGGPFEATSFATLVQTFTVGTKDVESGGGFLVSRHFMPGYGVFQIEDSAKDNYVSIRTTKDGANFSPEGYPLSGMHGGFRGSTPTLFYRLHGEPLTQGDQVVITYGDTSDGGRGLRMPDVASDFVPFPIYVAFDDSLHMISLPIQPITVTGTAVHDVAVFAPSVVKPGESFQISVRTEDRFLNRPNTVSPALAVSMNGNSVASIVSKEVPITVIDVTGINEPGVYSFSAESADGRLSGESNPVLVDPMDAPNARRIYWGDTHGHSGFAEGIGTPDYFMRWASEDAFLDFVTHSEHDIWMDSFEWNVLKANVEKFSTDRFIAFLGYEWTRPKWVGGHHNVLFRDTKNRVRIGSQTHGSLSRLYQGLRDHHALTDVIVIPHAHQPGDYRMSDPDLEPLVEIMSQHGTFEWFGRLYLQHGHQVGFIAASDNHLSQPGYSLPRAGSLSQRSGLAGVLSNEKSRDGIFDALRNLSAYATTGDRIILSFEVNGTPMGQRIAFSEERKISGRVIGTQPIDEISIIKNDEILWQRNYRLEAGSDTPADGRYQLRFASSSTPHHPHDNPRGWVRWHGTLTVKDASLSNIDAMDFSNEQTQYLRSETKTSFEFSTQTRGDASSVLFDLHGVNDDTHVVLDLLPYREGGGGPPTFRRHQGEDAKSVVLRFEHFRDGQIVEEVSASDYVDEIALRKIRAQGEYDIRFDIEDRSRLQGDYYYVRVVQSNDAMAWSSPIWVGGYASR